MKFPKNRANIYVVVRDDFSDGIGSRMTGTSILGVFSDLVEADNYKDACASEWFDKTKGEPAHFDVTLSTYYG
jgi:hypothetical protein